MISKKLFYIALIIALSIVLTGWVYAEPVVTNITINNSQLPLLTIKNLNITLAPNATLFIDRVDDEPLLNITYANETFFGESFSMSIPFTVSIRTNVTKNTTLVSLFNLTSDQNNLTFQFSIIAFIKHIPLPQPDPVGETEESFVTILNNRYAVNITTNVLPKKGELQYNIGGRPGDQLNISCPSGWLTCPEHTTFGSDNKTSFNIEYLVPLDAPLGETNYTINLTTINISRSTTIAFNVNEPDITFASYQFGDECFVEVKGADFFAVTWDCIEKQEEYNIQRLTQMYNRIQALRNDSSFCQIEPEIETEYVVVADIDKDVWDDYEACKYERTTLNEKLEKCHDTADRNREKYDACQNALNNNESECLSSTFATSVRLKNESEEYKKKVVKGVWTLIIWAIIIIAIGILAVKIYKRHKNEDWYK